jgi:hypothetical protein
MPVNMAYKDNIYTTYNTATPPQDGANGVLGKGAKLKGDQCLMSYAKQFK